LKTVVITGGSSIAYSAFNGCNSLESITIPFVGNTLNGTSNTWLGYIFGATENNGYENQNSRIPSSLKMVIITGGNTIPDYAFYECRNLTSVKFESMIAEADFSTSTFNNLGNLRDEYLAGGIGTYTREPGGMEWTKM
jgi:hypothetical protein